MTWKFAPNSRAFAGPVSRGIFWSYRILVGGLQSTKNWGERGNLAIFLIWLGNSFEIPNLPTWPPKMFWLPQVTLKHLVGTYIFITQFVKSFPHRKTLNLPDVLSPSPDTSLASLEIVSNFGKLKRMPFIYTNSMRNSVSLEIISKFAKLKQKIAEFENNLPFRQSPISPNSIGSDNLQIRQTQTKNRRDWK